MTSPLLEAAGLTKTYGRVEALRGIDLVARPGAAFTWVFILVGLATGNVQAAQGLGFW